MLKCTLILSLLLLGVLAEDRPIVKTPSGLIRGTYRNSRNGRQFTAFEGVPFAEPPIDELRFQESVPKKPWTGVWEANTVHQCIQRPHDPRHLGLIEGTEDCLYVNVYSPRLNDDKLMDVIVYIHGGAFMFGHGDLYGPDNLMDRDVVYVNFNYRLGVLGFLSTEDEVAPGNNGLKDQVLALKWVKNNIQYFGGNPDSVMLTGLSAGGSSTHYHYLSPLSRGLFHRGMSVSGNALCNWALVEKPLEKAKKLGFLVGCEYSSSKNLVDCLRQRSPKQIQAALKHFQPWLYTPYTPFGPVVEKHGNNKFLPDLPYNLLKQGKVYDVPWITSTTTEEGLYPAAEYVYSDDRLPYLEQHWEELFPSIFHYHDTVTEDQQNEVSRKIKEYYLKGKPISRQTYPELVQAIGDRLFLVDSEKAVRLQAKVNKSPVYYYRFSFRGSHSVSELYSHKDENLGVCHADDVLYVLSPSKIWFTSYLKTNEDIKMSEVLLDIWTSYAHTGKPKAPGTKWKSVFGKSSDDIRYLHIASPENLSMEKTDHLGHSTFWDSLPFNENEKLSSIKDEL